MKEGRGTLFVMTGPSGAGLPAIVSALLAKRSELVTVTPVTARKQKSGEKDGESYYFYDLEQWNAMKAAGDLLETTELAGNDYGTSRPLVEAQLSAGRSVVLGLEVARAAMLKANMPEAVCVYLEPSEEELQRRYAALSHNAFELKARLAWAAQERAASDFCDRRIVTDDPALAVRELEALLG